MGPARSLIGNARPRERKTMQASQPHGNNNSGKLCGGQGLVPPGPVQQFLRKSIRTQCLPGGPKDDDMPKWMLEEGRGVWENEDSTVDVTKATELRTNSAIEYNNQNRANYSRNRPQNKNK